MFRSRPALMVALLSSAPPTDRFMSRPLDRSPDWFRAPAYWKDRSAADCSVPKPCSTCAMTVRLLPPSSLPWPFFSVSATMRALPWAATSPPWLSSSRVVRVRS
ncbi:hypothetical protein D3C73_1277500 [compost metagenome]